MATGGKTHGLKYHARTICATAAETSEWLAGTTALTEENEVTLYQSTVSFGKALLRASILPTMCCFDSLS